MTFCSDISLVDKVIVGKNGHLNGNSIIDAKVILLTLPIIVIFVKFNLGCYFLTYKNKIR